MRRLFRLTCVAAVAIGLCMPNLAVACFLPPLPPPPPQAAMESDEEFAARSRAWYADLNERAREEFLSRAAPEQERMWQVAERIVLARVVNVGSIRLRGSEGQWYESPLASLQPLRWLKGASSARRLRVHFLSDDSCDSGAGPAPEGDVGEVFLLFYGHGALNPRNIIGTIGQWNAATSRSESELREQ